MIGNPWIFHHIGIATDNIQLKTSLYSRLGYKVTDSFVDENLGVKGTFMEGPGPRVEILQNLPGSDILGKISPGDDIHHTAYMTSKNANIKELCEALDGFLVQEPLVSVYFKCRIFFVMKRDNSLIEVILNDGKFLI